MQAIKQFETQILTRKPKREKPQSIFIIDLFYNNLVSTNWLGCTHTLFHQHPLVGGNNPLFLVTTNWQESHNFLYKHQPA